MPPHGRHVDDYDNVREPTRGIRRDRDGRDIRERDAVTRDSGRSRGAMDIDTPRISSRLNEPDIIGRDSQQQRVANAGVPRQDARIARTIPSARDRDDDIMHDSRPSQYTSSRDQQGPRRTPYEGEFDDIPQAVRPIIDPGRSRDEPRPDYNEYFLPADGIDRGVIQSEICRYLGQDAVCKPGTNTDGRRGYVIRAYRALTSEMIRSLKEDSAKYLRMKEDAQRRKQQPMSFETFRDQTRYGDGAMDIDEPEDRYSSRYDEPRIRAPPVTSYVSEPGYPAYLPVTQPPPPGVESRLDPRFIPGNTTPPTGRTTGYGSVLPPTTRATATHGSIGTYADSRRDVVRDTYGSYGSDPRSRHR